MKKKFKRNNGNKEKREKKKKKSIHVGPTLGVNLKVEVLGVGPWDPQSMHKFSLLNFRRFEIQRKSPSPATSEELKSSKTEATNYAKEKK